MAIEFEAMDCIGCGVCEMACSFMRDSTFGFLSSSLMLYRGEEKKHYFGLMLKTENSLVLARPEGNETQKLGESTGGSSDASAKPALLREGCMDCDDPPCAKVCPANVIKKV